MSGRRIIKFYKGPAFTADLWESRNPYLRSGEIGYLLEGGITIAAKVGPGYWNDLGFIGEDIYTHADLVTNPIGDATGSLQGEKVIDILKLMLSPYQAPIISNVRNNAGGSYANIVTREIGQSASSPFSILYDINSSDNLIAGNSINVTAGGALVSEGDFPNTGNISATLVTPNPVTLTTISILVKAKHTNGITAGVTTLIKFTPKIMWVSSIVDTIPDGSTFMAQGGRQTLISDTYKHDYDVNGSGYTWIAIPTMLGISNPIFSDVTDPNAIAGYDMESKGTISINNGVATYNYTLYRSTFNLILPNKLRIS
jgi:hypothetical protein